MSINLFLLELANENLQEATIKEHKKTISNLLSKNIIIEENGKYKLDKMYEAGIIDISSSGRGYLELIGSTKPDILIESKNLNGASKDDIVVAKIRFFNKRLRATVVLILANKYPHIIAYTKKTNNFVNIFNIVNNLKINTKASQKSLKLLPDSTIIKIETNGLKIIDVLGHISDPLVDEKISLAIYDRSDNFSADTIKEIKSFSENVDINLYPDREDMRALPFCTIDPIDAKDHDDAVYFDIKDNSLYVAIADVSQYVHPFTSIDKDAKKRAFTIYLPHKSIPMIPKKLSEGACSLKPNRDRLVFVFKINFDTNFKIKDYKCFEAIINSKKKYSYQDVDIILNNDCKDENPQIVNSLKAINKMAKILKKSRLEKGFDYHNQEIKIFLNKSLQIVDSKKYKSKESNSLIEESMLLANCCASNMLDGYGIFRTHQEPSFSKINNLKEAMFEFGMDIKSNNSFDIIKEIQKQATKNKMRKDIDKLIIMAQQKARYSSKIDKHFGLGFKSYSHFTSPIRRYSDLILHRILKTIIKKENKAKKFILKNIDSACDLINSTEKTINSVEFDFRDRIFSRWAFDNINIELDAMISDIKNRPIATIEDNCPINGARVFIDSDIEVKLFSKIRVKVVSSDIINKKIAVKFLFLR
jgi:ribonuclease R